VAITVILFQQQLTNPNRTKGPQQGGRTYLHLWWLSQNCYLFPLSTPLFQFSLHGQEQGFSKSQRISCLLCIKLEKAKRGQLENSWAMVPMLSREMCTCLQKDASCESFHKWCKEMALSSYILKKEGKYICDPCKYILIGHGVKRSL